LSKPAASTGWVCAFCIVPVIAIIAVALLALSPARHHGAASTAPASPVASHAGSVMPAARGRIQANYASLPLAFEQNQGQTDAQVKYMARGDGYILFLTANDAVFSLQSRSAEGRPSALRRGTVRAENPSQGKAPKDSTAVVRMHLAGGNSLARVSASGQLPGKSNYFLGNDPSKWHADVPHYARVSYQDFYPGVNLAFHGARRQTEFDFVVAPGANASPIGFHFTGAQSIKTDDSGNLVISSAAGDVLLHKPVAYQEQNGARQLVDARFVLKAGNVSFALGNYDRSRELVIDPSVSYAYSTYLGGSGADEGYGIAFDSTGDAYVTGQTASTNFPVIGSSKLLGAANVFVTKIAADGSSLVYSTYIGGKGTDSGNAIAVDLTSGNAFIAGGTSSNDFPVLPNPGAFQASLTGAGNAFVLELSSSGTLMYSTYLGGSLTALGAASTDTALGIALASDSSGDVYVVGQTSANDFPTLTPLQTFVTGSTQSGFVTKLNSSGTALAFSTYLGGSNPGGSVGDLAGAVAVDSSNNAYVTGHTFSSTFPTKNPVQPHCNSCSGGNSNAFVTVINPTGSAYVYSTFLGGSGTDEAKGIAVDSTQNAYVTGTTTSSDFPLQSPLQKTYGGNSDAFVTKLNPAGSALVYSTYLGGSGFDAGAGIAVDGGNNAYVTGQTNSTNFTTASPTQSALNGGNNTTNSDAFVSEVNSTGSALVFSTYLGGSGEEDAGGNFGAIAVDSHGATIYVTGNTAPPTTPPGPNNFPVSLSAEQSIPGGGTDAFVVTYTQTTFNLAATAPAAVSPGSSGTSTVTLTSVNGYSSAVNLSCAVSGGGTPAPSCSAASSFSPASPITPTTGGATTTLTITTTGPSAAMAVPGKIFYAMWLPIAGMSLAGVSFGSARSRRKKVISLLMIGLVMAALLVMPACGGSSGGGGGGGGQSGTPAGSYTVTITGTGTDASATTQTTQVTLTVN
jgi:hypothetical protein